MLRKRNRLRALNLLCWLPRPSWPAPLPLLRKLTSRPGNLVVSRSVYDNNPNNVKVGQILPPNCARHTGGCAGPATNDGTYP